MSHLIFSWENGTALPSRINIIGSGYLSFLGTGYLKPPSNVWEIILPNRTKPILHYKGWKWQTLAFPAVLHEVLAPVQSSTSPWPPLKNLIWKLVWPLGWEDPLKEEMATHSSVLAWRIPWTEEPGGYSPWGRKESDTAERVSNGTWKAKSWRWSISCPGCGSSTNSHQGQWFRCCTRIVHTLTRLQQRKSSSPAPWYDPWHHSQFPKRYCKLLLCFNKLPFWWSSG